jgi:glycosyltransferase involved in cell wall biosynthesis
MRRCRNSGAALHALSCFCRFLAHHLFSPLSYTQIVIHGKRIIVVMPAYNAAATLENTYVELPLDMIDDVVLVDDASKDDTVEVAQRLGITTVVHPRNRGYGGNQKTCYGTAIEREADVVIMVHPDYQYDPRLVLAMCAMIIDGPYDAVIGSRILCGTAMAGGMPWWKYVANRFLTFVENWCLGAKLSEYHTGFRAYSREILESLPLESYSDDFVFDNEMLADVLLAGFSVGEISCPTKYFQDASSINFSRSMRYGVGVLRVSIRGLIRRVRRPVLMPTEPLG